MVSQRRARNIRLLALGAALVATARIVTAGTLQVPGTYPTIQAAIDAAIAGDVVEIADGTYTGSGNKNLDFGGKAITVRSASGDPALCIIDCQKDGRGFYFHSFEASTSVVDGITVRHGIADSSSPGYGFGGGIYCNGSSPTFTNCTISRCLARGWKAAGGGVCSHSGSPTLIGCRLEDNAVPDPFSFGGGVYCDSGNAILTNCTITGNSAWERGGGFYCWGGSPTVTNCSISRNATDRGGGVYLGSTNATLTGCRIVANSARGGGGVTCEQTGGPTLVACTISDNAAYGGGGLEFFRNDNAKLVNCAILRNSASGGGGGGGILCQESTPTLTNCTISSNTSSGNGGGLICYEAANPKLSNCVLWGDAPQEIYIDSGTPAVQYCDIQGGWTGAGNVDVDPLFSLAGDYHLRASSPCIDAGTNSPPGGMPATDADGNARPLDGDGDMLAVADLGAYEFNAAAPSIAVEQTEFEFSAPVGGSAPASQTLSLRNCGGATLNWTISGAPAWLTLAPAAGTSSGQINEATLGVDISGLSHGLYAEVLDIVDPQAANSPRKVTVTLRLTSTLHVPSEHATIRAAIDAAVGGDAIEVADGTYTGAGNKDLEFGGKAITVRSASGDPDLCRIDCEGVGRGFYLHGREGASSVIEGLTIANGHVSDDDRGGAVCCYHSGVTVKRCVLADNSAASGGGISVDGVGDLIVEDSWITGNSAQSPYYGDGGGICCYSKGIISLVRCTVRGNSSTQGAGGINMFEGTPLLVDCTIADNSTASYGGGVVSAYNDPVFWNCTITGNSADGAAGGLDFGGGVATMTNTTVVGNTATLGGGGVHTGSNSDVVVSNSIVRDNSPQQITVGAPATAAVSYSNVEGGWTGEGNIDADPLFASADDFHLLPGSPCIDAGTNGPPGGLPPEDADGNTRPLDGDGDGLAVADMGAYEYLAGDLDRNGIVDLEDFAAWVSCLAGPAGGVSPDCPVADLDADGDVDVADFSRLSRIFGH